MLKPNDRERRYETEKKSRESVFAASQIGSTLALKGELTGHENVVISGQFQGKIELGSHNLTVERQAKVKADIFVNNITIKGEVNGNVNATGIITIEKDGKMTGDISACRVAIMDGAQFKGSIKMNPLPPGRTGSQPL